MILTGRAFRSTMKSCKRDKPAGWKAAAYGLQREGGTAMQIGVMEIRLHIPWSHSLKEKRMVVKSIVAKIRHVYNVSVAEVAEQDIHQIAVLGIACVSDSTAHADSVLDHVLDFIEENAEAPLLHVQREIR